MRVITLNQAEVEEHCRQLLDQLKADSYQPDLLVGIRSGGARVGEIIHRLSPATPYLECDAIRNLSRKKKSFMTQWLNRLPRFILDLMRVAEAKLAFHRKNRTNFALVAIPEAVGQYNDILVIDDAVDSGATIDVVCRKIATVNPRARVKVAAFTVTGSQPIKEADYCLYRKATLIRFPWSIDAKN